jgi:glyoxylase-like metal-dependent hydrolase (beta-lactamase superfamily II)
MFGIIPKPLWSRAVEVDDQNRIPLATTCIYLESDGQRILVETGCGDSAKYPEKERGFFRLSDFSITDSLAAINVDPASIDLVILTHLHFDHAGGGTLPDGKGGHSLTFPNAKYVVQRGEWDDAVNVHAVMSGTYRPENLAPLEAAGVLSFVTGPADIAPGLSVVPMVGHTRHQQGVVFTGGDRRVLLPADLMPTSAHAGIRYNMAYDLLPYENMINKDRLLREALEGRWQLLLGQDPTHAAWHITQNDKGRITLGH